MATRRWIKIGSGAAIGVTTIVGLFFLLTALYGFQITDKTGDITCEGTYANPCVSLFDVKNPNNYVVDIYSKDQVKLDFSPNIKDYALFTKDGRCGATGACACVLNNGQKIGYKGWRCVDFTNATKVRNDTAYNFRFNKYSTTNFMLVGIKNDPADTVKWGFGTNGSYLDPTWFGVSGQFEWVDPTPADGYTGTNISINLNASIYAPSKISKITFINNFNESLVLTNYSWYTTRLKFFTNFDNNSLIGDNSSYAVDLSPWGNNATITGNGNRTFVAGKYGMAYSSNSSTIGYVGLNYTNVIPNATEEMSFCAWLNMTTNSATLSNYQGIYMFSGSGNNWKRVMYLYNSSSPYFGFEFWNASTSTGPSGALPLGRWIHLCVAFNATTIDLYVDGKYNKSSNTLAGSVNTSFPYNTNRIGAMGSTTQFSNGLIDDPMVFDKKLTAAEYYSIYTSQLTEHSPDNWTMEIYNQQTPLTTESFVYNYSLCVADSTSAENCSATQTFVRIPREVSLASNFSNVTGTVREKFYGVGLQGPRIYSTIDTNCDSSYETARNYTWFQDTLHNSGATIAYYDASLHAYYDVFSNFGFEDWGNTSIIYLSSNYSFFPLGMWEMDSYRDGTGYVYRTTDAHSGSYAAQMNVTGGQSLIMNKYGSFNLEVGKTYEASVWLKGQGSVYVGWLYRGIGQNYTTATLNSTWVQYKFSVTPNSSQTSVWRFTVDTSGGLDNVTIDDFNLTENGIEKHWRMTGNLSGFIEEFTDNYENGITSVIIMDYMQTNLANRHSNCVDSITDTDIGDCMPTSGDEHIYTEMEIDFYQRVDQYRNVSYVQFWNEPNGGFFEDNLAQDAAKTDFVLYFNSSYVGFQEYNPDIVIAGFRGSGSTVNSTGISPFMRMMISNLSSQFKVISFNPYSTYYSDPSLSSTSRGRTSERVAYLKSQCDIYGAECSWIMATEWQATFSGKNLSSGNSARFKMETAANLIDIMNSYPGNMSEFPYHWDDRVSYFNCPAQYGEYPSFWSSVSEAGLDNAEPTLYPPYTEPQIFSELCAEGSNVVGTDPSDTVMMTSCKKDGRYAAVIANTGNESLDLNNYSLYDYPYDKINNYETDEVYNVVDGKVDLGTINSTTRIYLVRDSAVNYQIELPLAVLRFQNCSPDWENAYSIPSGQNETIASLNVTNNGVGTMDFFMNVTGALNTGWTIFASNSTQGHYYFNGSSLVNISNSESLNISNMTEGIGLEAWINMDSYGCFRRILAKSPLTDVAPYTIYGLNVDCNTSSYLNPGVRSVRMELAFGGHQYFIRSTTSLNPGEWYHIFGTFNTTDGARLYINGALDNSTLWNVTSYGPFTLVAVTDFSSLGTLDTNNNTLAIGAQTRESGVPLNYFRGRIDEPGVYNRSPSASEVAARYAQGRKEVTPSTTGLVSMWHLSDSLNDIKGLNNGTNYGASRVWDFQGSLGQTIQLNTTAQRIISDVAEGQTKQIWLQANCSYINANPGRSIEVFGG